MFVVEVKVCLHGRLVVFYWILLYEVCLGYLLNGKTLSTCRTASEMHVSTRGVSPISQPYTYISISGQGQVTTC